MFYAGAPSLRLLYLFIKTFPAAGPKALLLSYFWSSFMCFLLRAPPFMGLRSRPINVIGVGVYAYIRRLIVSRGFLISAPLLLVLLLKML